MPGRDREVILSHNLWQRLGADANIIGKNLRINTQSYSVVGVLAPGVADRLTIELAVPLAFTPDQINRSFRWLLVVGRMKPGVSIAQAQSDMHVITQRIAQDHPDTSRNWSVSVEPFRNDFLSQQTVRTYWLLLGAVVLVLLIACVNVANLLLARGTARQREVAVRAALGANRRQLFTHFLMESFLLALMGGALGVALAHSLIKAVMAIIPDFIVTPTSASTRLSCFSR